MGVFCFLDIRGVCTNLMVCCFSLSILLVFCLLLLFSALLWDFTWVYTRGFVFR